VNRSIGEVGEVPPTVVTVTSTTPVPAGAIAVSKADEMKVTPVAAVVPNAAVEVGVKPVPMMLTLTPPPAGLVGGLMLVTVGGGM
jgi:hypothetical protein